MKRRFVTLLLCIVALFFISCSVSDDDYRPLIEEPTFGTLVFIDSEGNIHEWTEDGDFSGMTPVIIED